MSIGRPFPRRWALLAAAATCVAATAGVIGVRWTAASAETAPTAASDGCGKAPTLTSGTYTMQVSGKNRSYILKMPDSYDRNHPYRLIFGMHWLGGNATDVAGGGSPYYGLQRLANNSAIFVAPQGLTDNMGTGWPNTGGQDVAFVDEMVKKFEGDLCVDTSQLYSLGFSYGGGMSYALACARAKVFRAVAIYSGGLISACNGGTDPIAYFQAHGINDTVLPIATAQTMRNTFAKNNGCTAANPPSVSSGSRTHNTYNYTGCKPGYPTVWSTFDDGHTANPADSADPTWLATATWKFFTQFASTPTPSGSPSASSASPSASVSPSKPTPSSSSPTSPTSPTSPNPTGTCKVNATVNSWNSGLTASLTITNTAQTAINGWTLQFPLASGQAITSGWNATFTTSGGVVTARNASYNGSIPAGGSTTIGFQASHSGNTAAPATFTLNGATCSAA